MKNITINSTLKKKVLLACMPALYSGFVQAQMLDLADQPLFLQDSVQPNILFVTDDSGSMGWEILLNKGTGAPGDTRQDSSGDNIAQLDFTPMNDIQAEDLCPGKNTMAYDPNRTYTPWKGIDEDGQNYPRITTLSPTIAPYNNGPLIDPYDGHGSDDGDNIDLDDNDIDDLADHMYFIWTDRDNDGEFDETVGGQRECPVLSSYPGTVSGSDPFGPRKDVCRATTGCFVVGDFTTEMHGAPGNQQLAIENYATWFTYYRRRAFVAQRAITELIDSSDARMGVGTLHNRNNVGTPITDMTVSANKDALQQAVGNIGHSGGTPLRRALYRAGQYYQDGNSLLFDGMGSDIGSPILDRSDGGACQQNFAILISDGFWNGLFTGLGNEDGNDDSDHDGETTGNLYGDDQSNTLGDIAMHFYETDLSTLPNEVPEINPVNNNVLSNEFHQHMVTYTVAFGVTGNIDCDPRIQTCRDSFASPLCDPLTSSSCSLWPSPITTNSEDTIDDMRHAAVNSRGQFLSANNPDQLIAQLEEAIADIDARNSSSAAVASNSTSLNANSVVYQARFNTGDWHGDLISTPISSGPDDTRSSCIGFRAGQVCGEPNWNAGTDDDGVNSLNFDSERVIITYSAGAAVPFRWPSDYTSPTVGEMDVGQVAAFLANAPSGGQDEYGQNLVNYLRGDQSNELAADGTSPTPNSIFRRRANSVLGDIINSAPRYVGPPSSDYTANDYATFASNNESRRKMVYVGANDGMLHGFDADDGDLEFSYIPEASYPYIRELAEPSYQHRYFVDGSPRHGDVYFGGNWNTVLVSGHKAGGQNIFALNITDPSKFTEDQNDIDDVFMWEFNHEELGYTFSEPDIVQLNNGVWATIFGNGYNNTEADGQASTTGFASLFILDISDGSLIRNISTNTGTVGTPNGLATVTPVDQDRNGTTDYIYAGDLEGNLWRFDVSSNTSSAWNVTRIFTAISPQVTPQPITSRPSVGFHPEGRDGFVIYFGTGRYLDVDDNVTSGVDTQTFYAIWDDLTTGALPTITRGGINYLQQSIISQGTGENPLRITSDSEGINWSVHKGWFMDLEYPTGTNNGERQISRSLLIGDRIVFVTIIPDTVACNFGGTSFLMELQANSGRPYTEAVLDVNDDGVIDASDLDPSLRVPSGIGMPGISTQPNLLKGSDSTGEREPDNKLTSNSSGQVFSIRELPISAESRRTSWTELVTF